MRAGEANLFRRLVGYIALTVLASLVGCATDTPSSEPLAAGSSAVTTTTKTLQLSLPLGAKLHDLAVVASSSIALGSNGQVTGTTGTPNSLPTIAVSVKIVVV